MPETEGFLFYFFPTLWYNDFIIILRSVFHFYPKEGSPCPVSPL